MSATSQHLFHAGTIIGTHGLRGDMKIRPVTSGSQALLEATQVELVCRDNRRVVADVTKSSWHKQQILLVLKGFEHINKIESFVGAEVYMAVDELPDLDEDSHYWHQLEGLQVVDKRAGKLGVLTSLLETGAHDVYVVEGPHGEVMFPAVAALITEIDLDRGVIQVDLPDGLVEVNE
ncbi:16S rRNA processing protein RimM [Desulfuromonas acetoxidans]|uniref:ribosome maturation factor RimM n=1 Tax=Desulfuromonas acetoxidans TaxID=891 RepID=UPI00138A0AA5|nr:ribosome maturation factor RimM [Desulfuromonas acetoxidans]MBF0645555.1 16S rRNA processing protein RimM [Desulfuromonas acetoxidans]NVD23357.1 16S rRNA processing protein RimM [Desulfuromonas acetoxidans]NVE15402.1 16S rRNA processing protein RimM [Desulfuromonas acetoxidans]